MAKYYVDVNENGTYWHKDEEMWILHREDGPAIEYASGSKSWYKDGKIHREDGPAVVSAGGYKYWKINGDYHREDGPAVEYANGTCEYWLNGKYYLTKDQWEAALRPEELTVVQIEQLLGKRIKIIKESCDD